jgi:general secretion pathway protein F
VSLELGRGLTEAERQVMFTRLSSMLTSRVGTSEALALMRDTFSGRIREVSGKLLSYLDSGDDLAEAIERVGAPDFPEATVALVKAGARSGETGRAIKDAAHFEYELHNIKKGASKGLWSGLFAFLFAGVLTIVSTLYIGPKIMGSDLIKSAGSGVDISWVNTTANVIGYTMAFLLALATALWLLGSVGRKILPSQSDALILRIPFYKDLILARNNFIVFYGLSLLIRSGVRLEEALRLSAHGAPRGALKNDLLAGERAVKAGKPWAAAMKTLHPTDRAALLSAVDREQTASTLDTLASQYRELYAQRLASFVPVVNMLAAIFMTVAGGILFGESILPMLMASKSLLG